MVIEEPSPSGRVISAAAQEPTPRAPTTRSPIRGASALLVMASLLLAFGCGNSHVVYPTSRDGSLAPGLDALHFETILRDSGPSEDRDAEAIPDPGIAPDTSALGDADARAAPGRYLHPCTQNTDCYSGFCVQSVTGMVCTKTCGETSLCADGWLCKRGGTGTDQRFICVPVDTFLCRPCHKDSDCNAPDLPSVGVCVQHGSAGSFCSRPCGRGTPPCPDPFECASIKPHGADSQPVDLCTSTQPDVCKCLPRFKGASTTCEISDSFGTCTGTVACTGKTTSPMPACNARTPKQEVCDGKDDDCNGKTDDHALDCTTYYQDHDGDGYGLGNGECLCHKPSTGTWVTKGGDCNDLVASVHPGATEVCNGIDDNCDGRIDEPGSVGCTEMYKDGDGDGYGVDGTGQCLCQGTPGRATKKGDCNDQNPNIHPGAEEKCDGVDDNCNGKTDEPGAIGCNPYFIDLDGDGWGQKDKVKCLCGPTGVYIATKPGDCNDANPNVHPGAIEICDGIDDNCNGQTDEGSAASLCPQIANGTAGCVKGACGLVACKPGWTDADHDPTNGCECPIQTIRPPGSVGTSCQKPIDLGPVDDSGQTPLETTDNLPVAGMEDWYTFQAIDGANTNGCNTFDVKIDFLHNPQDQFALDIYDGGCAGSQQTCSQITSYERDVRINPATTTGKDGNPLGECPCVDEAPDAGKSATSPGVAQCSDQTRTYFIRVYRKPNLPPKCSAYTLTISNGR